MQLQLLAGRKTVKGESSAADRTVLFIQKLYGKDFMQKISEQHN